MSKNEKLNEKTEKQQENIATFYFKDAATLRIAKKIIGELNIFYKSLHILPIKIISHKKEELNVIGTQLQISTLILRLHNGSHIFSLTETGSDKFVKGQIQIKKPELSSKHENRIVQHLHKSSEFYQLTRQNLLEILLEANSNPKIGSLELENLQSEFTFLNYNILIGFSKFTYLP